MPHPRIAVVLNPTAGRGAAARALPRVKELLAKSGRDVTYLTTSRRGEGQSLAAEAIESGADLIVAMGGDGTLHEVTNAVLSADRDDVALGLIPFGTGNDFARGVGLRCDLDKVVAALTEGTLHGIDVGVIEGSGLSEPRYFLVAAGVGFVADTAKTVNDGIRGLSGPAAYVYGAVKTLRGFVPIDLELCIDGSAVQSLSAMLLSISNVATTGGGIRIAPDAVPDDGLLDLCLVTKMSKAGLLQKLPAAFVGKHVTDPRVTMTCAKTIEIETALPSQLWIDGEVMGYTPARIAVRPGVLKMMLPSSFANRRTA